MSPGDLWRCMILLNSFLLAMFMWVLVRSQLDHSINRNSDLHLFHNKLTFQLHFYSPEYSRNFFFFLVTGTFREGLFGCFLESLFSVNATFIFGCMFWFLERSNVGTFWRNFAEDPWLVVWNFSIQETLGKTWQSSSSVIWTLEERSNNDHRN